MGLSGSQLAALRDFAHEAAESTGKRPGWARWGFGGDAPWGKNDIDTLLSMGLLTMEEEWMDNWLQPTEAGWEALSHA